MTMVATALRLVIFAVAGPGQLVSRKAGLWDGIFLRFSDDIMNPQQQPDISCVMEIEKKFGLEILPPPGA